MINDLEKLFDVICETYDFSLKNYRAVADDPKTPENERKTYCNFVVRHACKILGYTKFEGMLASQMVAHMKNSPEWRIVNDTEALSLVNEGQLVIAGIEDVPHGHVVVCRPGKPAFSSKWQNGIFVPKCMNIGANFTLDAGVNFAFKKQPEYFVWL